VATPAQFAQNGSVAGFDKAHRTVIFASSLGTVFEWYDFYLYGSLSAVIAKHFFSGVNETTGFMPETDRKPNCLAPSVIDDASGSLPQGKCLLRLIAHIGSEIHHRLSIAWSRLDHHHDRSDVGKDSVVERRSR